MRFVDFRKLMFFSHNQKIITDILVSCALFNSLLFQNSVDNSEATRNRITPIFGFFVQKKQSSHYWYIIKLFWNKTKWSFFEYKWVNSGLNSILLP